MGLIRLITIAVLIWLAWALYRRFVHYKNSAISANREKQKKPAIKAVKRCAVCGIHIPENEAIKKQDRYFCCEQHSNQDSV